MKREKELDREILAFSISHDHTSVRIYGHYPVIKGDKTTFYRHPIVETSDAEGLIISSVAILKQGLRFFIVTG